MDDIYQRQELLEIYKNPSNYGKIPDATSEVVEKNPFCGDTIDLTIKIEGEKMVDAKFEGDSCSVTIITASMLTEELIGKDISDVRNYSKEDLLDLIGFELTTSRVKCAEIVLNAFKRAVEEYDSK